MPGGSHRSSPSHAGRWGNRTEAARGSLRGLHQARPDCRRRERRRCVLLLPGNVVLGSEPGPVSCHYSIRPESARLLKMASPSHTFHFVSGAGTRVDSRFHWARVKDETTSGRPSSALNSRPRIPGNRTRRIGLRFASTRWNAWPRWSSRVTRPATRNIPFRAGSRH